MENAGSSAENPDDASLYEAESDETVVPAEILARGQEALQAYKDALKSGKTKNRRVLVTVVGPARAGKTSLWRSLKGEDFNPAEESTVGVVLQKAFCKPTENSWCEEDSDKDDSYNTRMAKIIAERLNSNTSQNIAEEPVTETDASSYPTIASDISLDESQTSSDDQEDSGSTDDEGELINMNSRAKLSQETEELEASKIPAEIRDLLNHLETNENDGRTNEKDISFKTVDFAGQQVFEVLLPLLMSSKSIYILVYSLKNDLFERAQSKVKHGKSERGLEYHFEMTNLETIEFWLSCISSYTKKGGESVVTGETQVAVPPVFVACTHEDKCKQEPREVARELCTRLKGSDPCGKHVMRKVYTVNNTLSGNKKIEDESVKRLKADIEELSKDLPQMDEYIPLNWLKFEEELSNLVENEQKRYIDIEEATRIANKCKVNTAVESNEFDTLLNYLHDLKTIIYFEKTKTVFIDTQWLINMFVKVITVLPFEEVEDYDADYWRKLEDEGVLERALVEHVWKDIADDGQNTVDSLLLIMENFSLICRWTLGDEEVFLVPCMLYNSERSEDINDFLEDPKSSTMIIRFKSVHLPLGIYPRLVVAVAEHSKKKWPKANPKLCPNFFRMYDVEDGRFDICISSGIRTICIAVLNNHNIDSQPVTEFCQSVGNLLAQIFADMRRNLPWMENMEFEYGIRCPVCSTSRKKCKFHKMERCTRDSCLHFVSEEKLEKGHPKCYECKTKSDNLIKEETYAHWFPKKSKEMAATASEGLESSGAPRGPSGSIKLSTSFNLSDNHKRWIVVGIGLNKTLLPDLRDFLAQEMSKHYADVKDNNNIDKQNLAKHLETDGRCSLNYSSINNNEGKRKTNPLFDFDVKSEVDLGKLYLKPFMAKFTGFDDTCDLSAVLGILSSASVFSSDVQDSARKVRDDVRNEWGHCNFLTWDEAKFTSCFQLMDSLIRELKLPSDEEKRITDELKDWEARGVDLCMGNTMDADKLLEFVQYGEVEIKRLSQEVKRLERSQIEDVERITESLHSIREALAKDKKEIYKRMEVLEEIMEANKRAIDANKRDIDVNKRDIDANKRDIDANKRDIDANKRDIYANKRDSDANKKEIEEMKIALKTDKEENLKRFEALEETVETLKVIPLK